MPNRAVHDAPRCDTHHLAARTGPGGKLIHVVLWRLSMPMALAKPAPSPVRDYPTQSALDLCTEFFLGRDDKTATEKRHTELAD